VILHTIRNSILPEYNV